MYTERKINVKETVVVGSKTVSYSRMFGEKEIETNRNGDVYIEVPKDVFDMELPDDTKADIARFFPSLADVTILADLFSGSVVKADDTSVCFITGIFNVKFVMEPVETGEVDESGAAIMEDVYKLNEYGRRINNNFKQRLKHASDFEFNMFMEALAAEDLSNVYLTNPYQEDIKEY